MRYREILHETYVNVLQHEQKARYAEEVLALIEQAYSYTGGHLNYKSVDDLLSEDSWWKLVRRNGVITVAAIYKRKRGTKRVCIATDGSAGAKQDLLAMVAEDIRLTRNWSEASGKAANWFIRNGLPPVSNEIAGELIGKEILALHGRFKYDRLIAGHVHTKIIIGYPEGVELQIEAPHENSEVYFQ